jgi:heat-inducible transcriptional repressor
MITDTGRVEQRVVELPGPVPADDISELRRKLNATLGGAKLIETPSLVATLVEQADDDSRATMTVVASVLLETLVERQEERIALAGTANLTRGNTLDFAGSLRPILEALEEEVILLKLFEEITSGGARGGALIRIGDENEVGLHGTSVVSTGYGPGTTVVGGMGVLGPTRMDYPGNIATVRAVARYVGDLLAQH